MTSRPASGRGGHARSVRMVLSTLVLVMATGNASAQSVTPELFTPVRDGFRVPETSPLRRITVTGPRVDDAAAELATPPRPGQKTDFDALPDPPPAPSRIGQVPRYGLPEKATAAGKDTQGRTGSSDQRASSSVGYDAFNRPRKTPRYYPGQPRPKPPGPGTPLVTAPPLPYFGRPRIAPPPSLYANKTPLPAAMSGQVPGQPPRRRLKPDEDPFGPVGDYLGSFMIKSALEVSAGYDSNPARLQSPRGSGVYVIAPEVVAFSDWDRHAVVADLRGSFTGYGTELPAQINGFANPAPVVIDRPDFIGHVDGRLDASRDLRLTGQARLRVATDNPGSPNVQAGLARYPVYATFGTTAGVDYSLNRLQLSSGATIDRTVYQDSTLSDGTTAANADREFTQFGGVGRVSYDLLPGVKPFGEIQADTRVHDVAIDRSGYRRDSTGGYVKAGTSFELTRLLSGEVSLGYATRSYVDSRLSRLDGLLTSASLVWKPTGLTTVKFISDTTVGETTLAGTSGILTRTYSVQVDHDFRRWLTGIGKFTFGTLDYQGGGRNDRTWSLQGDVVYKMSRSLWVKGTLRHDRLDSNLPGLSSNGTVMLVGVRVQN